MNNPHVYCVILAGGSGERLWPLSRNRMPKQFLPVADTTTLLEQTITRVQPLVTDASKIWISTTEQYVTQIEKMVGHRIGRIIVEPCARNTGPAILYSCYQLQAHDPQAQVIFLPSDAFIIPSDYERFCIAVHQAIDSLVIAPGKIALVGVTPSYAATGYGYIEYADSQSGQCFSVVRFHEKPSHDVADYYLQCKNMLWNIGVVIVRVDSCIALCKKYADELSYGMKQVMQGSMEYQDLPAISFDYALLEKSDQVVVVPVDIAWSDVGNLNVLLALASSNTSKAQVFLNNSHNNLVYAHGKLVALVGVDDLCIVDTGDVLLVARRSQAESVKVIVAQLKQAGLSDYL